MKRHLTGKAFMTLGLICVLFLLPAETFSWNQATHAYIADRLGARAGYGNLDEMWGSVAPDFFNYVFDQALCPTWVSDQTHGTYSETFLKVRDAADTDAEHALAFGFVSHNQDWGADYVAHVSGLRPGYENDGYIIIKARQLLTTPVDPANLQQTFGDAFANLGMSPDMALLVAHVITEYAIDVRLGNEVDPLLGRKLATAARNETKKFQPMLVKAFAADYAAYCFGGDYPTAASELTSAEKGHRKDMIYLGQAISQSKPVAAQLLAEQLAAVLSDLGLSVPVDILKAAMFSAMGICDDYKAEIDATVEFVKKSLEDHGITYSMRPENRR
jgi:hypothetical protein